jgi:predicted aldo/keto reductase-like oxidoreductase
MTIFDNCFLIGLGTARFPINGPGDESGIESAVALVLKALDLGVNYIDTSHIYSGGMAQTVLKHAFARTNRPYSVTLKVQYGLDKTADDALRRAETSLASMGLSKAAFFVLWSVKSYAEFETIMRRGGLYEAAIKLKDSDIIEHICVSSHAPVDDTIRIIESGAFEGITISYSLLNAIAMQPILEAAQAHNVGVAVMNPLAGGIIPQNRTFFSYACNERETNPVQAALRYITAQPAIRIILSGCTSVKELEENISIVVAADAETPTDRITRVNERILQLRGFCTGCRYCDACPQGIPIPSVMQSRNVLLFEPPPDYNRKDRKILSSIALFRKLYFDFGLDMGQIEDNCIRCGKCEKECTQHLHICEAVSDNYERARNAGYTKGSAKERLGKLLNGKGYKEMGFYPSGGYAEYVLRLYREFFGDPEWNILMFNGNPKVQGTRSGGYVIHSPDEILKLKPDAILINSYTYRDAIYKELKQYERQGIDILLLHTDTDIPWVW